MRLYARSARNDQPPQSYRSHIIGVVSRAKENVENLKPLITPALYMDYQRIVQEAAIMHDLGKLSDENQEILSGRIKSKKLPIDHRDAGIKYLMEEQDNLLAALLIFAHHKPGLPNVFEERLLPNPFRMKSAMKFTDIELHRYLEMHNQEVGVLNPTGGNITSKRLRSLDLRVLLSCLVDADYTDASGNESVYIDPQWGKRLSKLDEYVESLQSNSEDKLTERDQLRQELYDTCKNSDSTGSMYYCDSPVGTGKTTAVLAHMLKTAIEKDLRRIFIVLPYSNIISQTVKVLREAIILEGENPCEIVAEHHHQADFESPDLRRVASTWTAPIVVTTAVQFFETLASNQPAKLRKLHQLPGSGIIIDESHAALPIKLMPLAWKWISDLADHWGCCWWLSSATSFRFWESRTFEQISSTRPSPLVDPDLSIKMEIHEKNRLHLNVIREGLLLFETADHLIDYIEEFEYSRLLVVNTVRSAAYLANRMRNQGHNVLFLSTSLSPYDRELVIDEVKYRLDRKNLYHENWTLVATSCIECGMNFSFHNGFCEQSSLNSYIQLGGRISRNAEYSNGKLICFTCKDSNFGYNPDFEVPKIVFSKQISSGDLTNLSLTQAVTKNFEMECADLGGIDLQMIKYEKDNSYRLVSKYFKVIEEESKTVLVPSEVTKRFQNNENISRREVQLHSVSLRNSVAKKLGIDPEDPLPILKEHQYDPFLGYMKTLI